MFNLKALQHLSQTRGNGFSCVDVNCLNKRVYISFLRMFLFTWRAGFGKSALNGWYRKPALRCFYIYIISIRTHHLGFCCGIQAWQDLKFLLGMGLFIPQRVFNSVLLKEDRLLDLRTQS